MRLALAVVGVVVCLSHCAGPARATGTPATAAEPQVTPELICTVQDAIRWRASAWNSQRCVGVAESLNATDAPTTMAAICTLESDLRPGAIAWAKFQGRSGSARAPRTVGRAGGSTRTTNRHPGSGGHRARLWTSSAGATPRAGDVADVGLCGVRCVLGADLKCANGPARGETIESLKDPAVNIRVAGEILKQKRRVLGRARATAGYNGDLDGRNGYAANVRAVMAAWTGVELEAKGRKRVIERVRELVRRIAAAVRRERRA